MVSLVVAVGWHAIGGVRYSPPFVPVSFLIDSTGHIAVEGEAHIVTEFGEFAVDAGAEQALQPSDSGILVIIRHNLNGALSDAAYNINENQSEITVTLDGKTTVQITNRRVFIDASQGQVTRIDLTSAGSNANTPSDSGAIAYCLQLPDFQSKSALASWGPDFSDVPTMSGSVSYLEQSFYDRQYHFLLFDVCTGSIAPDSVRAFYSSGLPRNGWQQSDTFPYAGDPSRGCGDLYCWVKGSSPTRYASLEKLDPRGPGVSYQLRLGILP